MLMKLTKEVVAITKIIRILLICCAIGELCVLVSAVAPWVMGNNYDHDPFALKIILIITLPMIILEIIGIMIATLRIKKAKIENK